MAHKYYICTDCRRVYGHQRVYCPSCPKQMQHLELSTIELEALLKQGYNGTEQHEWLFDGKVYTDSNKLFTDFAAKMQPLFNFPLSNAKTPGGYSDLLKSRGDQYKRCFYIYYEDDKLKIEFARPVYFRARGSTIVYDWWKL